MGSGYNFNRRFGLLVEYHFDHSNIPQGFLSASYPVNYFSYYPTGPLNGPLNGNTHLWSITAEPIFHYFSTERFGGYVIGGGGFYRKLTTINSSLDSFTCRQYVAPCLASPGTQFADNDWGLNIGTGFARRISDTSNAKFFIEARYVWVDSRPHSDYTGYLAANSRIGYIPLTGGLRW